MADDWPDLSFDIFVVHDPDLTTNNKNFVAATRPIPNYSPKSAPRRDGKVRIGSFGFAAADKGFEELVILAQKSFPRCVIRLRISASDFGDPDGSKANALVARCRGLIVRDGVELEAAHDFLNREELIEFLASNDINALLYDANRGAGGTSSAGDWLVAAGRPIALRRGIMFRNFNATNPSVFVDDLPLEKILENGTAAIEKLREQWSPEEIVRNYEIAVTKAVTRAAERQPSIARSAAIAESAIRAISTRIEQQDNRLIEFETAFVALQGKSTNDDLRILNLEGTINDLRGAAKRNSSSSETTPTDHLLG
jgi:hypothetical protein